MSRFHSFSLCSAILFGLSGCGGGGGGGGGGTGGGDAAQAPVVATSGTVPATPTPSQDLAATPAPVPGPAVADYTPNYVPNLAATRRWEHKVVTVGVTLPAPDSTGTVPDPSPLIQQAIDLWSQKVGQDVQFQIVPNGPDDSPDVTVSWAAPSTLPGEAIGRTLVQFRTDDQVLISAQISVVESLPDSFKVQVVAHELGHAMGIDGHSDEQNDLMYPNAHLPAVITESDQNTVLWSYQVGQTRSVTPPTPTGFGGGISSAEYVCGVQ